MRALPTKVLAKINDKPSRSGFFCGYSKESVPLQNGLNPVLIGFSDHGFDSRRPTNHRHLTPLS